MYLSNIEVLPAQTCNIKYMNICSSCQIHERLTNKKNCSDYTLFALNFGVCSVYLLCQNVFFNLMLFSY